MDLTQLKVAQLHDYVQRFQHVDNFEELLQIIDWNFLFSILHTTDKEAIAGRLEEVFQDSKEEIFTIPIFLDEELENPLILAHVEDNPYNGEVAAIFEALHLHQHVSELGRQPEPVTIPTGIDDYASNDGGRAAILEQANIERAEKVKKEPPVTSGRSSDPRSPTTSNQPATSSPVVHLHPYGLGHYNDKQTKLGKPAAIEITNLNVLTKPEVSAVSSKIRQAQVEPFKPGKGSPFVLADKLKYIRRKSFGFGEQKRPQQLSPLKIVPTSASPVQEPSTGVPATGPKSNRRISMVEDSLPPYIRKQLESHILPKTPPPLTPLTLPGDHVLDTPQGLAGHSPAPSTLQEQRDHFDDSKPPVTLTRKQSSRLRNLLSNSQSLYTISKNTIPSLPPSQSESQASTASDYLNDTDDDGILEEEDEDDREYLLPTAVSPYLGFEDEDNEDFPDFENLSREDSAKGENGDLEDDDDEDDDDEDEDDEYLFANIK